LLTDAPFSLLDRSLTTPPATQKKKKLIFAPQPSSNNKTFSRANSFPEPVIAFGEKKKQKQKQKSLSV
jgi:hypothetical protein